jgi:hypothetical protein
LRNWHQENWPRLCLKITLANAEAKRMETMKVHDTFQQKFEKRLANSEETWKPFSQMVKAMCSNCSKRGSPQQVGSRRPRHSGN